MSKRTKNTRRKISWPPDTDKLAVKLAKRRKEPKGVSGLLTKLVTAEAIL